MTVSFALGCFVALLLPYYASGFWPAALDMFAGAALAPQALFLGITSCVCLFVGMAGTASEEEKRPKSDVEFFLAVFLGWYAISLLTAQYRHDAILETARAGGVLCWFFLVREWFKKLDPEKFVAHLLLFLGCITVGALTVVIPALADFLKTHNPRQFGTFYNPNLFANFCAMAAPLAAGGAFYALRLTGRFNRAGKVLSAFFGLAALLLFLGLIVTSSKGGLLAFLLGAIVFVIAMIKATGKAMGVALAQRKAILAPLGLVIIIVAGALLSVTVWPRLATSLHDDHSSMFRWFTWIGTVKMAMARPIFGWGPGSFPDIFPLFAIAGYTRSAHQSWLQLAAENGWPAMVIFLLAAGAAWRGGWRALKTSRYPVAAGALAALTAFVVHGMVDSGWGIISVGWLLILVLSLLATLEAIPESPRSLEKPTSLNWPWLAGAIVLGGLSWVTQHTVQGEDLRAESLQQLSDDPQQAIATAQSAINSDPANRRLWENLGRVQWALGKDATKAYRKSISLQPFRAASYLDLARYYQNIDPQKHRDEISKLYDTAIQYDPHDTTLRMARAEWKLQHQGSSGWDDLRFILNLQQLPYGKYPAVPENVDFNYGQAAIMLAGHALDQKDASAAQSLLATAAAELKKEDKFVNDPYQQRILQSVGKSNAADAAKLAKLQAEYDALTQRLHSQQQAS